MSGSNGINLFVNVSVETHTKLATLAATLKVGRQELYRQAITWASNQPEFVVDLAKLYSGNVDQVKP